MCVEREGIQEVEFISEIERENFNKISIVPGLQNITIENFRLAVRGFMDRWNFLCLDPLAVGARELIGLNENCTIDESYEEYINRQGHFLPDIIACRLFLLLREPIPDIYWGDSDMERAYVGFFTFDLY